MKYYLDYVTTMGGNTEVSEWISTVLEKRAARKRLDQTEAEHVLDYLLSDAAPKRLRRMSYDQAKIAADKWSKANQKHGRDITETASDVEVIHAFDDGSRIVRLLTKNAFQHEGFLMSHCLGGYNPHAKDTHIYSYRDQRNMPHATFEFKKSGKQITQIKGKGNGSIHPRYIHQILIFLKNVGVKVRQSEMGNLGYHHVPKENLDLLEPIQGAKEQLQDIFGEKYLYWSGSFA